MKLWNSKKVRKWLRILHRDIGYFAVGISLLYAVSGIILNHKKQGVDPAYKSIVVSVSIDTNLSVEAIKQYWKNEVESPKLNKVLPHNNGYKLFIDGGTGEYAPSSGSLNYEVYKKRPITHFINLLHLNQKDRWTAVGDFSAIALIFLALSGLFMVAGKNGFKQRGVWFMIAGFVLVIVFIWL